MADKRTPARAFRLAHQTGVMYFEVMSGPVVEYHTANARLSRKRVARTIVVKGIASVIVVDLDEGGRIIAIRSG